ncbi:UvrD-helicase domain-containing protein [Mitsuaria sp. 7]|uniref:UvrD-helicase domain-containing protein n=1 Tax=Mitsuaria sp. 7 TaxID=1658665 RepID=UPI0007DD87E8|nr:UvrD-helicase domain-containing protein [Mitsuaria sp. 7]ANH69203.1 hypothetical protein ABE85_19460 [Mitsuaria sp. 7]
MEDDVDILVARRGSVIAPAGCGKTELISTSLRGATDGKPALVLTHTNAGVHALELRLRAKGVPRSSFRVATIDNWSLRIATMFPSTSGFTPQQGRRRTTPDYGKQKDCALAVLKSGILDDPLTCTYSRLIVDEYQDCTLRQHEIVVEIARALPTVVLGDPLQAVFGWPGNTLVGWKDHVESAFPRIGVLRKPWRWINAGTQPFGEWLIGIRKTLYAGEPLDLSQAPPEVVWVPVKGPKDIEARRQVCSVRAEGGGSVLIIADGKEKEVQRNMACITPGASTVEAVDLKDLMTFAGNFVPSETGSLEQLLLFASELITKVDQAGLKLRLASLQKMTARTPATPVEAASLHYLSSPSFENAKRVLEALAAKDGARIYRPAIFYPCLDAMRLMTKGQGDFYDAAVSVRERQRHEGRRLPRHAVGSTLLLKGLEADVAIILNPEKMTKEHLYVALTRGAKSVFICSETSTVHLKQ